MYKENTLMSTEESSQLQLFLSARGLKDMDIFSKSDPYVRVLCKRPGNPNWVLVGRTETIDNNLNPNFQKSFVLNYVFESRQDLRFEVMDEDDKTNASNDDYIGWAETTLGACAGAREQTSILNLMGKEGVASGKLIVRVQPVSNSNQFVKMKWSARKLINTDSWFDWWDKSDPYLKFLKVRNDNTLIEAARTNVIQNNLNPSWLVVEVPIAKLLRSDNEEGGFKVECWDWEEEGEVKHQFIGAVMLRMSDLRGLKLPTQFTLVNPKEKKPGFVVLQGLQFYEKPTFMSYLQGGLQLNLSVAIDFTGSNGVVTHPTSLHYLGNQLNQYQQAILAIGGILLNYDYDKRIPAFGFGARLRFPNMGTNIVSHCFPLSGCQQQIEAVGIDGLMMMYRNAQMNVELSGPTYFSPIISQFVNLAYQSHQQGGNSYQVLLILTDGAIHDMDKTIDLLVQNCNLPLSIIIVGVGSADFTNMNTLDGDNGLFNAKGVKATRDIVQFVPFNEVQMNPDLLAKELLAELPGQVVQYMAMMGRLPNKPVEVNMQGLLMEGKGDIEAGLKATLPSLFAGLTINP